MCPESGLSASLGSNRFIFFGAWPNPFRRPQFHLGLSTCLRAGQDRVHRGFQSTGPVPTPVEHRKWGASTRSPNFTDRCLAARQDDKSQGPSRGARPRGWVAGPVSVQPRAQSRAGGWGPVFWGQRRGPCSEKLHDLGCRVTSEAGCVSLFKFAILNVLILTHL